MKRKSKIKELSISIIILLVISVFQAIGSGAAQCPKGHFEEANGIVSMEAENFESNNGWSVKTAKSGYSGSGYIEGGGGATAKYSIKFNTSGTYWVHIRSLSTNDVDNGAYTYLDGKSITGKIYFKKTGGWVWWATKQGTSRQTKISFNLSSPGTHEFSIKPGVASGETAKIDKIVVHLNGTYNNSGDGGISGKGPAESTNCGGGATNIYKNTIGIITRNQKINTIEYFSLNGKILRIDAEKTSRLSDLLNMQFPQGIYYARLNTPAGSFYQKLNFFPVK